MRPVRLLHVTDPHLFGDASQAIYGVNTALSLRRVLAQALQAGRPDAAVVTGDIADDRSAAAYELFRDELRPLGVPVLCLPGNHDAPSLMRSMLNGDGFSHCARSMLGDWAVILLDSHLPTEPSGELSGSELARLDSELRECAGRHTLVCLHHPPVPVGSDWLDALGLHNAADFLAVIDRHPQVRVVLAGHVHQEFEAGRRGVRILTTPSTCAQFTPRTDSCVMDVRPPGYRTLSLLPDGTVETEVHWLRDWVVSARPPDSRAGFMS
jgi:Icc protein